MNDTARAVEKKDITSSLTDSMLTVWSNGMLAAQNYLAALSSYTHDFWVPFGIAVRYFTEVESEKLIRTPPVENWQSYLRLGQFNLDLYSRANLHGMAAANRTAEQELQRYLAALQNAWLKGNLNDLVDFADRQRRLSDLLVRVYPQTIAAIAPEYGFHFERGHNPLVLETDRFHLYQIMPTDPAVKTRLDGKPLLILPPYVLGANILGFLPGEKRSYAHCYANRGVPTYIRVLKPIATTEALQTMSGEDDARDTRLFCETIMRRHGRPVTLNGYCQGGFSALCNLLSGELDELVDAFITCVAPMDGTRSKGLSGFLGHLPPRFNDLMYGSKRLPNGNVVADGTLMGWVYKLASIEQENPVATFFRDLMMFARQQGDEPKISKTAAALNYWLAYERNDLPMEITRMSFASFTTPITADGTLPVKLFGRHLNLKRIAEKGLPWLICYGEGDNLVEKETALAPLDHVQAEVSPFPKGHVAIATSWSAPNSACALHTRFGSGNWRGPVRFHLDLETQTEPKPEESGPQAVPLMQQP